MWFTGQEKGLEGRKPIIDRGMGGSRGKKKSGWVWGEHFSKVCDYKWTFMFCATSKREERKIGKGGKKKATNRKMGE